MSKAILMSIRPEWLAKILNGEKLDEIRSRFPINYGGWVYMYCPKAKNRHDILIKHAMDGVYRVGNCFGSSNGKEHNEPLNGKVVARFWVDDVDELNCEFHDYELFGEDTVYQGIDLIDRDEDDTELYDKYNLVSNEDGDTNEEVYENNAFLKRCCLTLEDFKKYAKKKETLYDIHISKLEKFDKPKELNEFNTTKQQLVFIDQTQPIFQNIPLTKAPQSWQYIEVEE